MRSRSILGRLPVCIVLAGIGLFAATTQAGVFQKVNSPEEAARVWKLNEANGGHFVTGTIKNRESFSFERKDGRFELTVIEIQVRDYVGSHPKKPATMKALVYGGPTFHTTAGPALGDVAPGLQIAVFLRSASEHDFPLRHPLIEGINSIARVGTNRSGQSIVVGAGWQGHPMAATSKTGDYCARLEAAVNTLKKVK